MFLLKVIFGNRVFLFWGSKMYIEFWV